MLKVAAAREAVVQASPYAATTRSGIGDGFAMGSRRSGTSEKGGIVVVDGKEIMLGDGTLLDSSAGSPNDLSASILSTSCGEVKLHLPPPPLVGGNGSETSKDFGAGSSAARTGNGSLGSLLPPPPKSGVMNALLTAAIAAVKMKNHKQQGSMQVTTEREAVNAKAREQGTMGNGQPMSPTPPLPESSGVGPTGVSGARDFQCPLTPLTSGLSSINSLVPPLMLVTPGLLGLCDVDGSGGEGIGAGGAYKEESTEVVARESSDDGEGSTKGGSEMRPTSGDRSTAENPPETRALGLISERKFMGYPNGQPADRQDWGKALNRSHSLQSLDGNGGSNSLRPVSENDDFEDPFSDDGDCVSCEGGKKASEGVVDEATQERYGEATVKSEVVAANGDKVRIGPGCDVASSISTPKTNSRSVVLHLPQENQTIPTGGHLPIITAATTTASCSAAARAFVGPTAARPTQSGGLIPTTTLPYARDETLQLGRMSSMRSTRSTLSDISDLPDAVRPRSTTMDFSEGVRTVMDAAQGSSGNGGGGGNRNNGEEGAGSGHGATDSGETPQLQGAASGSVSVADTRAAAVGSGMGMRMNGMGIGGMDPRGNMGNMSQLPPHLYHSYSNFMMGQGNSNLGGIDNQMLLNASRRRMMSSIMTGVGMAAHHAIARQEGGSQGKVPGNNRGSISMGRMREMSMGMAGTGSQQLGGANSGGTGGIRTSFIGRPAASSMQSTPRKQQEAAVISQMRPRQFFPHQGHGTRENFPPAPSSVDATNVGLYQQQQQQQRQRRPPQA